MLISQAQAPWSPPIERAASEPLLGFLWTALIVAVVLAVAIAVIRWAGFHLGWKLGWLAARRDRRSVAPEHDR